MIQKMCILFCVDVATPTVLLALQEIDADLSIVNADEFSLEVIHNLLSDGSTKLCLHTTSVELANQIKSLAVNGSVRMYTSLVVKSRDYELQPSSLAWAKELCVDASTAASNLYIGAARYFQPRKYACAV